MKTLKRIEVKGVAMYYEHRNFSPLTRLVVLLLTGLFYAASLSAATGDWAGTVQDALYTSHLQTLRGTVFLDHPISGATVKIYDRSGKLLHSEALATRDNGAFSISGHLPAAFWIVIGEGVMEGTPFDHEVRRYVPEFRQGDFYKVNAVTTLMAEYQERHPEQSYTEVKKAVADYLSIPDTVDIGDDDCTNTGCYSFYFSHYFFMREAEGVGGLTPFVDLLLDEIGGGATHAFYDLESVGSGFFKDVMKELLLGASKEAGEEGAGWILGLLFGGDSNNDGRLDQMETDLKNVLCDLEQLIGALETLARQLAMDTNEVETYIQGLSAQDAISSIKTHYGPDGDDNHGSTNTLKYFSYLRSKDVDQTTKDQIETLVNNINGSWDIQLQVQKIHDAIVPDVGDDNGLLDLWTQKFILQGHVSDDQLMNYYKTLEQYFSALLFYQFKGANMVVEAMNYQSGNASAATAGTPSPAGETPASSYLTGTFQPMIKEETDRFLQGVVRLITENAGLYWESRFLPSTTQEILARATWFVAQTLGDEKYGLNVGLLGGDPLINDILTVGAYNDGFSEVQCINGGNTVTKISTPNRAYDSWGTLNNPDLNTLTRETGYSSINYSFGDYDQNGCGGVGLVHVSYCIYPDSDKAYYCDYSDSGNWYQAGDVELKKYNEYYVEDSSGTITYGYLLKGFRRGGREVIMDQSVFDSSDTNTHSGDVNWWSQNLFWGDGSLNLYVEGKNKYTNSSSSIDMKWYRQHSFTYSGNESVTAYLNVAAHAYGSIYVNDGTYPAEAHAHVWLGIEDLGTGDYQHVGKTYDYVQGTVSIDQRFNDQIQVTLKPGHRYSVYAHLMADGHNTNGDYHFKVTNHVDHLSLTFVNSEFGP